MRECGGDNSSCADCAGVPNGDSVDLGCGCGEASPSGCDEACGSTAVEDSCGICGGDGSTCCDWACNCSADSGNPSCDGNGGCECTGTLDCNGVCSTCPGFIGNTGNLDGTGLDNCGICDGPGMVATCEGNFGEDTPVPQNGYEGVYCDCGCSIQYGCGCNSEYPQSQYTPSYPF
jgi:hypothetical protein